MPNFTVSAVSSPLPPALESLLNVNVESAYRLRGVVARGLAYLVKDTNGHYWEVLSGSEPTDLGSDYTEALATIGSKHELSFQFHQNSELEVNVNQRIDYLNKVEHGEVEPINLDTVRENAASFAEEFYDAIALDCMADPFMARLSNGHYRIFSKSDTIDRMRAINARYRDYLRTASHDRTGVAAITTERLLEHETRPIALDQVAKFKVLQKWSEAFPLYNYDRLEEQYQHYYQAWLLMQHNPLGIFQPAQSLEEQRQAFIKQYEDKLRTFDTRMSSIVTNYLPEGLRVALATRQQRQNEQRDIDQRRRQLQDARQSAQAEFARFLIEPEIIVSKEAELQALEQSHGEIENEIREVNETIEQYRDAISELMHQLATQHESHEEPESNTDASLRQTLESLRKNLSEEEARLAGLRARLDTNAIDALRARDVIAHERDVYERGRVAAERQLDEANAAYHHPETGYDMLSIQYAIKSEELQAATTVVNEFSDDETLDALIAAFEEVVGVHRVAFPAGHPNRELFADIELSNDELRALLRLYLDGLKARDYRNGHDSIVVDELAPRRDEQRAVNDNYVGRLRHFEGPETFLQQHQILDPISNTMTINTNELEDLSIYQAIKAAAICKAYGFTPETAVRDVVGRPVLHPNVPEVVSEFIEAQSVTYLDSAYDMLTQYMQGESNFGMSQTLMTNLRNFGVEQVVQHQAVVALDSPRI